ncbi:penicillin-binding transpeptidase domain-containing protein [Streptomyces sp. NPDC006798]|uniref:penicillin-binding transpeptidase domain-containing protein n=1 Tax=Streptomyces sp. NPDC006798 TaxID=3155462 RepID=UPI0033F3D8D0
MIRPIRRAAGLCLLLLAALLVNAARVQVVDSPELDRNPANRRGPIARYAEPRGDILAGDRVITGSRDTREQLRFERVYPQGPMYAPVTGYASQTYGTSLVEHTEDAALSGADPLLSAIPLWNDLTRSRRPGGKVFTTIEPAAQEAAFRGLAGRRGAVAALEPSTGRILALVSSPSYDPGELSGTGPATRAAWRRLTSAATQPMLNRAIRQTYPPGSAFKIVTAAAALDAGLVRNVDAPTDTPEPYVLPGTRTRLPDATEGCGGASLAYAVQWSCNSVMAALGARTGLPAILRTAESFGFNDRSLRIPARVAPSNFDTRMSVDQVALSSIGQFNTTATPLQMAMVAAAVANGGQLRRPYLVDRVTTAGGRTVRQYHQRHYRQAMNPSTAHRLQRLMIRVVEDGTGRNAAIRGARVGGKTGTAQHGPDNTGIPYAWFIAWAQGDEAVQPGVAIAVVVEDAEAIRGRVSGNGSAAPIARAVMSAVLETPPTR